MSEGKLQRKIFMRQGVWFIGEVDLQKNTAVNVFELRLTASTEVAWIPVGLGLAKQSSEIDLETMMIEPNEAALKHMKETLEGKKEHKPCVLSVIQGKAALGDRLLERKGENA